MNDHKFTDDKVIKAVTRCANMTDCDSCILMNVCYKVRTFHKIISAILNRQKAENEELKKELTSITEKALLLAENAKTEAVKEFAERLKKKIYPYNGLDKKTYAINAGAVEKAIDDLVKETTEEISTK